MKLISKICLLFFTLTISCSCTDIRKKILYKYNGICITRIDMDGDESLFYYGDLLKVRNYPKPNVKIFWGQRDGGFGAYFIFNDDKSVEIVTELGWFEVVQKNPKFYLTVKLDASSKNYDYIEANKWYRNIQGNYNNIVYVSTLPINWEKDRNELNKSKVKIEYLEL